MYSEEFVGIVAYIVSHPLAHVAVTLLLAIIFQLILRSSIERIVHGVIRRHKYANHLDEEKREHTLVMIFRTASAVTIWITTIIVILWQLDVNVTALLTGAGLVGIVVGLGAQSAIRDFLAGIFIIAENQYRVGDIVTLRAAGKDVSGVVEDVTIRITRLRDLDGNVHIVQNGEAKVITNLSFGYANVNIDIGLDYSCDIDIVEQVMNDVGKRMFADKVWKPHIFEPIQFLRIDGLEDSAVRVKALGKVEPAMQWDVAGEYRRRLKKAFEEKDVPMPLPQLSVRQTK